MWISRYLIFCLSSLLLANLYAAESSNGFTLYPLYQESAAYSSYISEKNYPQIHLSESFGNISEEFQVTEYTPTQLYNYYLGKVCNGLYLANCLNNKKNILSYNKIDLNIESSLIQSPISSISGYRIIYASEDIYHQATKLSGAILIPQSNKPLRGVVLFYHFTVLDKGNIPSRFNRDSMQQTQLLASVFASDGYVVVIPDYPGYGVDNAQVHPYILYPEVNALSGIYMLKALAGLKVKLKFEKPEQAIKLFISGYSEGGSYALWATKILEENPNYLKQNGFSLKKTVAIEGAYNLSHVIVPFLLSNIDSAKAAPYYVENSLVAGFVKPGLVANVLNSYTHYNLGGDQRQAFNNSFYVCHECGAVAQYYDIAGLLESGPFNEMAKYRFLFNAAIDSGYSNSNNSIKSLTNPELIKSPQFLSRIESADIYNWRASGSITLLSLAHDSVVPALNAQTAYIAMTAKGSAKVKLIEVPNSDYQVLGYLALTDFNVDHLHGFSYLLLFARNEFDQSEE